MCTWGWWRTMSESRWSRDDYDRRGSQDSAAGCAQALVGTRGGRAQAVLSPARCGLLLLPAAGAVRRDLLERVRRGHRRPAGRRASAVPAILRRGHDCGGDHGDVVHDARGIDRERTAQRDTQAARWNAAATDGVLRGEG